MSKKDSSSETEENREIVIVDTEDAVEFSPREPSQPDDEFEGDSGIEPGTEPEQAAGEESAAESAAAAVSESGAETDKAAASESGAETDKDAVSGQKRNLPPARRRGLGARGSACSISC
jgi:hypothetical protein